MSNELKEKKFDNKTLIGGWYISPQVCDELIEYFNYNKKYIVEGTVIINKEDNQGSFVGVDKTAKDSKDLRIGAQNFDTIAGEYRAELKKVLDHYLEKYAWANETNEFNIVENLQIQKYGIGGGFKKWHFEFQGDRHIMRHLVFMTYLNDVDDGGTEFYYQKLKTKAEKGLTLIWPSSWTHTHRGVVSKTKEKYITTGWYNFL